MTNGSPAPTPVDTRERLLQAALAAFGHRDYDAVSTREIVERADANISAISYHFGGKQQLYLATARYVAERLQGGFGDELSHRRDMAARVSRAEAREQLGGLIRVLVTTLLRSDVGDAAAGFIFREQHQPTAAFDILYRDLLEPLHAAYAALLARVIGRRPDERETLLMTHALLGQIIAFRTAQTTILRRLQLHRLDADDVRDIADAIARLTLAAVAGGTSSEVRA